MGGVGIVNNPLAQRNRGRPGLAVRLRARLGDDGELVDASTPGQLAAAVERFRAAGIDLLAVNGGDGTGHRVLTAFARAYGPEPLPRLLLLRGGAMNTVAHGHGIAGSPEAILRAVLEQRRRGVALRTVERDLLRVEADGEPPLYGFLFGTGAVVTFLEAYGRCRRPSPWAAAGLLARAVGSALRGGAFAAALSRRERLRVESDGEPWPDDSYLTLLAGSTPDLGLGFRAFHRCGEQPGFFHAVGVTAQLGPLLLCLPRIHAGRPWRRRHALDELARELSAEGDRPRFAVDGDLYAARERLRVTTGPGISLVLP
jgi:diacylglycerol kinase (ATP)